ncbi:6186_t:CDS:1, partial [Acaulospora colombiana]
FFWFLVFERVEQGRPRAFRVYAASSGAGKVDPVRAFAYWNSVEFSY